MLASNEAAGRGGVCPMQGCLLVSYNEEGLYEGGGSQAAATTRNLLSSFSKLHVGSLLFYKEIY